MADLGRLRHRTTGALLILIVLLGGLWADARPAEAQGFGWLGGLFGGGTPQRSPGAPAYPGYGSADGQNSYYNAPRRHTQRRKTAHVGEQAQDATPAKPKVPPKAATIFVDVFGDSLGQLLANGLDDALADRTEVGVVHKAKGSTGLVTASYFDWPKTIDEQLGSKDPKDKIDVAVMMVGSNDRQPISQDGKRLEPRSEEWNAAYKKRVLAIDEAFAKKKIPLIWVGIPITKDDDFADDMAALNEIYRDAAAKTGATYVDTWEAFSDDNGDFAAFGPDINGQTVRLRSSDGIHFTKAGARKLAHFVEAHVRHDLDGKTPLPQLPTAEVPVTDEKGKPKDGKAAVAVAKPEAGPIKNLGEPPAAKDGRLSDLPKVERAGAAEAPKEAEANVAAASNGEKAKPDAAPITRADNFKWQGGSPPNP